MTVAGTKAPQALNESLKHLISLLGPIYDIADSLTSLRELPRALSDVTKLKGVVHGLVTKLHDKSAIPTKQHNAESIESLKHHVGELERTLKDGACTTFRHDIITSVLDELVTIKQEVKALRLGLDTNVSSPSISYMSELLGAANTVNRTLDHMRAKLDDPPKSPATVGVDLTGVERQLVDLNGKIVELKSFLDKTIQPDNLDRHVHPLTPVSKRLPLLPGDAPRDAPQSHRQSQQFSRRSRMSPFVSDQNHKTPIDVFGGIRFMPPAPEPESMEDGLSDPYDFLDRLAEPHQMQIVPPSSSTMIGSQKMRTVPLVSGSLTSSNGQHRVKRVKHHLGPSSVKTRAQQKISNTTDRPVIDDDTLPDPNNMLGSAEPRKNQDVLMSIEIDSPMTQTRLQMESHTLTTDENPNFLNPWTTIDYSGQSGTLQWATEKTPSVNESRRTMTYSSSDK